MRIAVLARNSFWMILQIVSLFRANRKLVPKFRLRGRDFGEKERREERMRKRVGNDGHVRKGSSMFVLSHPWCSHPVHFTTLGPSARTAKTGVIRTTTAYPSQSPVNKRREKSIYGAHSRANTFLSLFPSSVPQSPDISSRFSPLRRKVMLVSDAWLSPIFFREM